MQHVHPTMHMLSLLVFAQTSVAKARKEAFSAFLKVVEKRGQNIFNNNKEK
jgi:hypothetical protein